MNKFFAFLFCASVTFPVYADDLQQFFHDLRTLHGEFTQRVAAAALKSPRLTHGVFAVMRPGKFRWEYNKPYQQQLVSDGKNIWIYDVDLEQVTVKKWSAAVSDTPAQLLAGDGALEKSFTVKSLPVANGEIGYELTPNKTDTGFSAIKLVFAKHELKKMILQDALGQVTTLEFAHLQRNAAVDSKQFQFTPPKGVDVLEGQ